MNNKGEKVIKVNKQPLSKSVLVDITEFISFLRMTGFGLGCWCYSTEQLKDHIAKNDIKRTLKQFNLNFSDCEADYITNLLIEYSFSFSESELSSLKKYGTNSLASRVESKSKNLDYIINPEYIEAANAGFIDESISSLYSILYGKNAFPLAASGVSSKICSLNLIKTLISRQSVYKVEWDMPYVTFSSGLDFAGEINTLLSMSNDFNFKWELSFDFLPNKKLSWTIKIDGNQVAKSSYMTECMIVKHKQMIIDDVDFITQAINQI